MNFKQTNSKGRNRKLSRQANRGDRQGLRDLRQDGREHKRRSDGYSPKSRWGQRDTMGTERHEEHRNEHREKMNREEMDIRMKKTG